VSKAIAQHHAYEHCLASLEARVVSLPAEQKLPDSVFVEDTALVLDELAIITRMGAASRRAEVASIADALADYRSVKFLKRPATLDGGDVLRVGRKLLIGLSRRTSTEAIAQLRQLLVSYDYEVCGIEVKGCLHLKSACSYLGNNTVLLHRPWIATNRLNEFDMLDVAESEPAAANVLFLNNVVIMPQSFPKTRDLLEARGFQIRAVDVSELQKAEAGVTCCSLIFNQNDT
jgi:dimethylargininase